MKICMFTNTYLPHVGGVAKSVDTFSRDLQAMGHEVLVVAPVYKDGVDETGDETNVFRLPALQNFNGSDFSLRLPVPFLVDEKIDDFNPDIIHSHHPYLLGDAALRAARQRSLPLVFTHHTLYENYTHYVPLNSKAMRRFVINLSTEYANLCSKVVAPSQSVADLIKKRGVARPVEEIPTGVDVDLFSSGRRIALRRELGLSEIDFVLGHVGRLAPEKNLEYLSEAVSGCLLNKPHARFLLVGSGPSEKTIGQIFSTKGLGDRLITLGQKTGSELVDAYAAMDLFVFSSQSETQGMVLTEAMAAGKPVVALDASGAREVVHDGLNGKLLPAETPADVFASTLSALIEKEHQLDSFRQAARDTADRFSRKACVKKLIGLYESLEREHEPGKIAEMDQQPLTGVVERLKAEWDLIAGKTTAVVEALGPQEGETTIE